MNEAHVLAVGSGLKVSAESDGTLVSLELSAISLNYELRFRCVLIPDISLILLISSHNSVSIGISTSVETSSVHPGSSARSIKGVVLDGYIKSNSSSPSSLSSQSGGFISPLKDHTPLLVVLEVVGRVDLECCLQTRGIGSNTSLPLQSTLLSKSGSSESQLVLSRCS